MGPIKVTPGKIVIWAIVFVLAIFTIFASNNIFEKNNFGFYQIKQSWPKGNMTIRDNPGIYLQNFGDIGTYKISDVVFLSKDDADGGRGATEQAIRVQFPDGYADVSVVMQYELSSAIDDKFALHKKYSTNRAVKGMVRQQLVEALKNTGSLMNSEEAYADKRSEFIRLAEEQTKNGLYVPKIEIVTITNKDGTKRDEKRFDIKRDENDIPVINKLPVFATYGINIIQFNIKDMDFDPTLLGLIEARKDAQKARQEAVTAKAAGDALIAEERARQEIEKIKQVTIAQKDKQVAELKAEKEYEVAKFAALAAKQEKVKKIAVAEGIAEELRIADGLSEREKYQIDADVRRDIGVAEHMSKWVGPQIVAGGGTGGTGSGIENALMIKMMQELVKSDNK